MRIKSTLKSYFYKLKIKKSLNTVIICKKSNIYNSIFEGNNKINENTQFINGEIGIASYIGRNSILNEAKIGRFSSIGNNVKVVSGIHPTNGFVSSHPAFYSTRKQSGFTFVTKQKFNEYNKLDNKYSVVIGNDVWIGENVTILEGVRIGDGAVIGANSLVIKDIIPYTVNGGVPTKMIKKRFNDNKINFLMEFKWWNKPFNWLKNNQILFENIENLIDSVKED